MPEKSLKINTLFFFFECTVKVNGVTQLNSRQLNQTTFTINSFHWQPCGPLFPVITQIHCLHHCVFLDEALLGNWFANDSFKCWVCHLDSSYRSIQSQSLPVLGMKCMCHPVCKAYFLSSEHWRIAVSSAFASGVHIGVRFLTSIWSLVINITPRKQALENKTNTNRNIWWTTKNFLLKHQARFFSSNTFLSKLLLEPPIFKELKWVTSVTSPFQVVIQSSRLLINVFHKVYW